MTGAGKMRWYVDDQLVTGTSNVGTPFGEWTLPAGDAPFNAPFYLVLNQAVGGTWAKTNDDGTAIAVDQTRYEGSGNPVDIDWVRIYKKS